MSVGMNRVQLLGNVGAAPSLRYTQAGQAVLNIRLATNERWTDQQGEVHEKTEWHLIVAWGKRAEGLSKHVHKGSQLLIEGKLTTSSYEKDGQTHFRTEVVASNVVFVGAKTEAKPDDHTTQAGSNGTHAPAPAGEQYSEDIPF